MFGKCSGVCRRVIKGFMSYHKFLNVVRSVHESLTSVQECAGVV